MSPVNALLIVTFPPCLLFPFLPPCLPSVLGPPLPLRLFELKTRRCIASNKMGSWTRFRSLPCCRCNNSALTTREEGFCLDCENTAFVNQNSGSMVFLHLQRSFHLPQVTVRSIVNYLQWYGDASEFKRIHLTELLLTRGSAFRNFTYFGSSKHGTISAHEDIIDRIISFVVFHEPTTWIANWHRR